MPLQQISRRKISRQSFAQSPHRLSRYVVWKNSTSDTINKRCKGIDCQLLAVGIARQFLVVETRLLTKSPTHKNAFSNFSHQAPQAIVQYSHGTNA